MSASLIEHTPSAYDYPLLIKHLLHTPLAVAPDQEIVYRDISRYTYRTLRQRIGRLATGLAALGVKPGDTVAVMDWDSHRYLECYFAVPMMGAVLQTVNIRLSPEQILYTLNHARADVVLCLNEFLPLLDAIKENLETVKTFVLLSDGDAAAEQPHSLVTFSAEYEDLLAQQCSRTSIFLTLTRTRAPRPSIPPAPPAIRRGCILVTGNWCCTPWPCLAQSPVPPSTSASIVATSICPLLPCSTSMPGEFPMSQRPWASSRSTRVATCRRAY